MSYRVLINEIFGLWIFMHVVYRDGSQFSSTNLNMQIKFSSFLN